MFDKHDLAKPTKLTPRIVDEAPATTSIKNVRGVVRDIGRDAVTSRAEFICHQTDEGMVWQATPSLVLLIVPVFVSILVFCVALIGSQVVESRFMQARQQAVAHASQVSRPARTAKAARQAAMQQVVSMPEDDAAQLLVWIERFPYFIGAGLTLLVLCRFLVIKTTRYAATSQRLFIEKGIFLTRNVPHDLHDLGDFVVERPLVMRPFGVGNLRIAGKRTLAGNVVKSAEMPALVGVRNPDYVRDILRTGGQLEAQRSDKMRWR